MASRFTSLQVGGTITALATGVVALFLGIVQTQQVQFVNLPPAISGTGTTSTQLDYSKWAKKALTATGGVATYDTLSWSNPESYTGALLEFCLDVHTAAAPATTSDCGIVTDAGTGTGQTLLNNESLTRGVHCADVAGTSETLIGPDERIKCATKSGTGAGLDSKMHVRFRQAQL
jgi:hypothetical protein